MSGGKIRVAAHVEVAWVQGEAAACCPNCGAKEPARRLLEIDYRPPGAAHFFVLQVCGQCGAHFSDNPETMDYSSDELIEIGWHTYQIQLGAGVWPITAPLTRIDKPAGARMLEIGGAYGFGLDFGIRGRGWRGRGFDPSPLAEFGARELGLDVVQGYFGPDDLACSGAAAAYDVVLATEVVEHLAEPPAFFRLMRAAVGVDGILLLTTPDAAWITPDLPAAALMPLLSPGAHLVLQTAESLEFALRAAGFAQVLIKREAMSLIAYASPAPFALLEDPAAGRALYRRYLVERAETAAPLSDLRLGFAGRGLFEAANDGDAAPAASAWAVLVPAVQARFGLDLDTIEALPPGAAGASLAALGRVMPLGLGMILFGRAMQRLAAGEARANLLPLFRLTLQAIDALQGALAQRSLGDGLSADLRRAAEVEILICQADAGNAEVVAPLAALVAHEPARIIAAWRGLVGLVNAGAYDAATALQTELSLDEPTGLPADLRRDALMSLANLALAPGGETMRAFGYATGLREMGEPADDIVLQAFTRLANASRYDDALAVAADADFEDCLKRVGAGEAAQDARLARLVLDLAAGDPAEVPGRLAELDLEPERRQVLLLEAFVRLVNASRHDEATAYATRHEVPALAVERGGEAGRNAVIGLAVVALGAGDPASVPALLALLPVDPARAAALLFGAFTGLVNAGRYDEAAALERQEGLMARLPAHPGPAARDALVAAVLLAFQQGHTEVAVARISALDAAGGDQATSARLYVDGFVRLVNESRFEQARRLAAKHAVQRRLAQCPEALRHDAAAALLMLELQPGGDAGRIPALLEEASGAGLDEQRLQALALAAFVVLVNDTEFSVARRLRPLVDPLLVKLRPPYDEAARNGLFAAGVLALQDKEDWRRGAALFARLRDALVKLTPRQGSAPDPLFWPALRGEVLILHRLDRGAEAAALLAEFMPLYPDAPDDLRAQAEAAA